MEKIDKDSGKVDTTNERVIYTDGHDVTVTDSTLQVKNHEYLLSGVLKCGLMVLQPQRAPGIALLVLGVALVVVGIMQLIPSGIVPEFEVANRMLGANTLAIWIGAALALIGILVLGLVRERYAVRIATAEGEKDAVVSPKKEYVHQIVNAINQAIAYVRTNSTSRHFTVRSANS